MKWKNRFTNYNFWISIISAVLLILQAFKIEFDVAYFNEIATAVLGLLVVIGIISDPTKSYESKVKDTVSKVVKEEVKEEVKECVKEEPKSNEIKEEVSVVENDSNETNDDASLKDTPIDYTAKVEDEDTVLYTENDFQTIVDKIKNDLKKLNSLEDKSAIEKIVDLIKDEVTSNEKTENLMENTVENFDINLNQEEKQSEIIVPSFEVIEEQEVVQNLPMTNKESDENNIETNETVAEIPTCCNIVNN